LSGYEVTRQLISGYQNIRLTLSFPDGLIPDILHLVFPDDLVSLSSFAIVKMPYGTATGYLASIFLFISVAVTAAEKPLSQPGSPM
jgi:hypothetical protein